MSKPLFVTEQEEHITGDRLKLARVLPGELAFELIPKSQNSWWLTRQKGGLEGGKDISGRGNGLCQGRRQEKGCTRLEALSIAGMDRAQGGRG